MGRQTPAEIVVQHFQARLRVFRKDAFKKLTTKQQVSVLQDCGRIAKTAKRKYGKCRMTDDDILDAVFHALYYIKYGESPIDTALKVRGLKKPERRDSDDPKNLDTG